MSPGWQSNALHIASSVENLMAFAFPVLSIERLDSVKSTLSDNSLSDILRRAIITSRFTIMGMAYMVSSFSFCNSTPLAKIVAIT